MFYLAWIRLFRFCKLTASLLTSDVNLTALSTDWEWAGMFGGCPCSSTRRSSSSLVTCSVKGGSKQWTLSRSTKFDHTLASQSIVGFCCIRIPWIWFLCGMTAGLLLIERIFSTALNLSSLLFEYTSEQEVFRVQTKAVALKYWPDYNLNIVIKLFQFDIHFEEQLWLLCKTSRSLDWKPHWTIRNHDKFHKDCQGYSNFCCWCPHIQR